MSLAVVDNKTGEINNLEIADSFREASPLLRRPFTPEAVKFKVQATFEDKQAGDGHMKGLIVAYIDARLAVERLNAVCPHLWHDEYQRVDGGGLICKLTVDGLTRWDLGEGTGKGVFSDAFKRAAVKFGVGVSLYAIPQFYVSTQSGTARPQQSKNGPTLALTKQGTQAVRQSYSEWLAAVGVKAFGTPLDHGDTDDTNGGHE